MTQTCVHRVDFMELSADLIGLGVTISNSFNITVTMI